MVITNRAIVQPPGTVSGWNRGASKAQLGRLPRQLHSLEGEVGQGCVMLPVVRQPGVPQRHPPPVQLACRVAHEPGEGGALEPVARLGSDAAAVRSFLVSGTSPGLARRGSCT